MLKLFFMSDKSFKTIQQAQDILKSILKDNYDKQIVDEKIKHTMQKLEKSKIEIKKNEQATKKQAKANMKELYKQKEKVKYLEMKLEQSTYKPKNSEGHNKKKDHQVGIYQDESQSHSTNYKYMYERQKRKKRQGQEKLKEYKDQNQKLQEKLAEKQRQIQNLRQQLQVQKLLIQEFMSPHSENSSQNSKNQDQFSEQQQIIKISLEESEDESKMMDLSEGRPQAEFEDEPRKLSQQQQTDDQFQDQQNLPPQINLGQKVSQIERSQFSQQDQSLKNSNSIKTQVSSLNKSTEYSQIIEMKAENQTAQSSEFESQKDIPKVIIEDKISKEVSVQKKQPETKISSLFSWIGWWKKSQKK